MFIRCRVIVVAYSSIYYVLLYTNYFISNRIITCNIAIFENGMLMDFVELFQLAQSLQAKNNHVSFGIYTS
jgi:hypothetical protein